MTGQSNLKDVQQVLATRLGGSAPGPSETRLAVGAGRARYLVRLEESGEVLPVPEIAPVPLARPWLLGLANVRGHLVSIVDFAAFAGEAPETRSNDARVVLLSDRLGLQCGLLVGRMLGLKTRSALERAHPREEVQGGAWRSARYVDREGTEWIELDLAKLAADERFLNAAR